MKKSASLAIGALALSGCASDMPRNMPLVFGESITVGIGVGASAADNGGDFTLGFKSKDIAVIPVVVYDQAGNPTLVQAENDERNQAAKAVQGAGDSKTTTTKPAEKVSSKDALSVLGVFSTDTSGTGRSVGIGKFFATGAAAQRIAEGFSNCLEKNGCRLDKADPAAKPGTGN